MKKEESTDTTTESKVAANPITTTETDLIDKEDQVLEESSLLEDEQLAAETDRQQLKRDLKPATSSQSVKQNYNNWFGRNDWSRRIQKVQGRIRFKNQNN